jgi:hypothetical protein
MKKTICFVLVIVTILAFSATAFAPPDYDAYWTSSVCLNGFTTTRYVEKADNETWSSTHV